jgi:hypothetical protein
MAVANNWTTGLDKIINLANEAKDLTLSGDSERMLSNMVPVEDFEA